jgi:hypothetical protein
MALLFSGASAGQSGTSPTQPSTAADDWTFAITPYVWVPGITGTFNFDVPPAGDSPVVEVGNYLENLKLAGMLSGTASKGEWGAYYDFVYVNIGQLRSKAQDVHGPGGIISLPVSASLDSGLEGLVATVTATHTWLKSSRIELGLIAGARYGNITTSASWDLTAPIGALTQSGRASKTIDFLDAVVGVMGRAELGEGGKWFLPMELDLGAGTRDSFTANGVLGVGYRFGWGDVVLAYRYLYCNLGSNGALHDVGLGGVALGATFRW